MRQVLHFLGIIHAHEACAGSLTRYLHVLHCFLNKGIPIYKLRGLGFVGTNTVSEERGVHIQMRVN